MAAPSSVLADEAEQHTQQLLLLINTVTAQATSNLTAALAAAQAAAITAWITAAGDITAHPRPPEIGRLVTDARARITTAMRDQHFTARRALEDGARQAARLGSRQASRFATFASGIPALPPPVPPTAPGTQEAIARVPEQIREQQNAALAFLTTAAVTAAGWTGIAAAFNAARRTVARIRAAAAWVCGTSAAAGTETFARRYTPGTDPAAERQPTLLLWAAEPGACPACAAYAGRFIEPGGTFPGGLTTGPPRTAIPGPIAGPPRHNHCRCVLVPWRTGWPPSLPALLAQRARSPRP